MQPFRAQSGNDLRRIVLIVELARITCGMHIALPNGTPLPATREAGLVQIAKALVEQYLQGRHNFDCSIELCVLSCSRLFGLKGGQDVGRNWLTLNGVPTLALV